MHSSGRTCLQGRALATMESCRHLTGNKKKPHSGAYAGLPTQLSGRKTLAEGARLTIRVQSAYLRLTSYHQSIISAIASHFSPSVEARAGFEPAHKGFADLSLTTWVPRQNDCGLRIVGCRLCAAVNSSQILVFTVRNPKSTFRTRWSSLRHKKKPRCLVGVVATGQVHRGSESDDQSA